MVTDPTFGDALDDTEGDVEFAALIEQSVDTLPASHDSRRQPPK